MSNRDGQGDLAPKDRLTPSADLVLRIMKISEVWGFDAINTNAIQQAFEILEPLISPYSSGVTEESPTKEQP